MSEKMTGSFCTENWCNYMQTLFYRH